METLRQRRRGGVGSDARKAFAWIAAKEYREPVCLIAEFLGVGSAAVSHMAHAGRKIVENRKPGV